MVGGYSRDADQGAVAKIPLVVDADLNEASALCRKNYAWPLLVTVQGRVSVGNEKAEKAGSSEQGIEEAVCRLSCRTCNPGVGTWGSSCRVQPTPGFFSAYPAVGTGGSSCWSAANARNLAGGGCEHPSPHPPSHQHRGHQHHHREHHYHHPHRDPGPVFL